MNAVRVQPWLEYILNRPVVVWLILGFTVAYCSFFVTPVFFSAENIMQFPRYVPAEEPIGLDLGLTISFSRSWLIAKQTPYVGQCTGQKNLYPPFATICFVPLLFASFPVAYRIVALATILAYCILTLVLSHSMTRRNRNLPVLVLVFATGLFSYGFHFELERGQFNVIAIVLCFLGIYIYHYHHRLRHWAYLAFVVSVQLKVYPGIFILMFVKNWADWRRNLRRLGILSAFNVLSLFVLGPATCVEFLKEIGEGSAHPYVWTGNHSIKSFVTLLSTRAGDAGMPDVQLWMAAHAGIVEVSLLSLVAFCVFLVIVIAYWRRKMGFDPYLLVVCTIASMLIPSISHDYKLPILAAPFGIALSAVRPPATTRERIISGLSLVAISVSYCSMLFSYVNKPMCLRNNFLPLMVVLLGFTILAQMDRPVAESGESFGENGKSRIPSSSIRL